MAEQHFDGADFGEQDGVARMSAVDIADWRLRTFALYATVRKIAADGPAEAHSYWRHERDRMFGTHPASPLTDEAKASFGGLKTADYDPIYRFHVPITKEGAGREMNVETGTDGVVRFVRLGAFHGVTGSGDDAEFVLDFNFAYNPSCAYNEAWACPLAGPSNRLAVDIPVGEL